jgi:hypothetical protein
MKNLLKICCFVLVILMLPATTCDYYCPYHNPYFNLVFTDNNDNVISSSYTKVYEKRLKKVIFNNSSLGSGALQSYNMPLPVDKQMLPVTYIFEKSTGVKDSLTLITNVEEIYQNTDCGVYIRHTNPRIVQEETSFPAQNIKISHEHPEIESIILMRIKL